MWRLADLPFSAGAHAYDIFEHGGDWWLREKLAPARFVHTSSHLARAGLIARGVDEGKVFVIRSGLDRLPSMQKLRSCRVPLRLLCVSRLVEKKGLDRQINIYAALRKAGLEFHARIVGNGPLRAGLEKLAGRLGVADRIAFTGEVPFQEVWEHLSWADVLLHTGVVAPSGDQDGLPNVIGEAMGAGVVVITSPTAATTEAVTDGVNGLVRSPDEAEAWVAALRRLAVDDRFCEALRAAGRRWVEENFNVDINTGKLLVHLRAAAGV
jgi:glycosyltransferase involved in cell wall biosynthesis